MAPGHIVEGQYLKIYTSVNAYLMRIVGLTIMILLIQWFKGWLFGTLFNLTGWSFIQTIAEGTLLAGFLLLLLVIWSVYMWLKWRSNYFEIYPDRIVIRKGIIARRTDEIEMSQFGAVSIDQGVIGRVLNFGDLRFATGSVGAVGRTLREIPQPEHYLRLINGMLGRVERTAATGMKTSKPVEPVEVRTKETAITAKTAPTIETVAEQAAGVAQTMSSRTEVPMRGEVNIGNSG